MDERASSPGWRVWAMPHVLYGRVNPYWMTNWASTKIWYRWLFEPIPGLFNLYCLDDKKKQPSANITMYKTRQQRTYPDSQQQYPTYCELHLRSLIFRYARHISLQNISAIVEGHGLFSAVQSCSIFQTLTESSSDRYESSWLVSSGESVVENDGGRRVMFNAARSSSSTRPSIFWRLKIVNNAERQCFFLSIVWKEAFEISNVMLIKYDGGWMK